MKRFLTTRAVTALIAVLVVAVLLAGCAIGTAPTGASPAAATPVSQPAAGASSAPSAASLEEVYTSVYENNSPGVVFIENNRARTGGFGLPAGGTGSGFVIDKEGYILTNNHVVDDAETIYVTLIDDTRVKATVVGTDPGNDLALLKVDVAADKLHPLTLGDSSAVKVGQLAVAIGNPFGLERTLTTGVISGLGKELDSSGSSRPLRGLIQTDAAVNPGNSGGPLFNARGEVIGITNAIESPSGGSVGVGFAIPINSAKSILSDLKAGNTIEHPRLGISGVKVTADLSTRLDLGVDSGAYVLSVMRNGPAAKAGIRGASTTSPMSIDDIVAGGDVITSVDGQAVKSVEEVASYIDTKRVGDTVNVTIVRDKQEMSIQVTLDAWPTEGQAPAN